MANSDENNKENLQTEADGSEKKTVSLSREKKALTKKEPEKSVAKKEKAKVSWTTELQRYLRGVVSEVKKVHWLGKREVVIYTIVVFVAVLFVGTLIWLFDSLLTFVLRLIM